MVNYNNDRQTSNATNSSSVAHQHITLLTPSDRSMPPMEADAAYQGCLASCEHSLSGVQAHTILRLHAWFTHSRDCAHVLRNLKITHTCYAIPRLPAHSRDSEYAQHNLEIAQIPRLRGTYMYLGICVCIHEMCSQHPPS